MSTHGFIGVTHNGRTRYVYNNSDSYPTYLGVQMTELIRAQGDKITAFVDRVLALTSVDDDDNPTAAQLEDLKDRGFWQQVDTGMNWYAALRNAQGDLRMYVEAGYIPTIEDPTSDSGLEWGYVINVDTEQLVVYTSDLTTRPVARIEFYQLIEMGEASIRPFMHGVETAGYTR